MAFEKSLRTVPRTEKIFRGKKRVQCFKAVDAITFLSKMGYSSDSIKAEIQSLLSSFKIVKVSPKKDSPDYIDIVPSRKLCAADMYMWAEEETNYMAVLYALLILAALLTLVLFQMWPMWLKRSVSYIRYPLGGFIAFLFVIGVIRLIVFGITYLTAPPGLWILPNLFAECGFFESFVPLYEWAGCGPADGDRKDK